MLLYLFTLRPFLLSPLELKIWQWYYSVGGFVSCSWILFVILFFIFLCLLQCNAFLSQRKCKNVRMDRHFQIFRLLCHNIETEDLFFCFLRWRLFCTYVKPLNLIIFIVRMDPSSWNSIELKPNIIYLNTAFINLFYLSLYFRIILIIISEKLDFWLRPISQEIMDFTIWALDWVTCIFPFVHYYW